MEIFLHNDQFAYTNGENLAIVSAEIHTHSNQR